MRTPIGVLVALAAISHGALAQNEAALRAAFEGKSATVKVDMPATSRGIDVFPQDATPVAWREVAGRMKEFGTALKPGQQVMITKVVVKKDSHIEFQLGGGGWGTFGDYMTSSSEVSSVDEGESKEERELREQIKQAPGPTRRKQLERELASKRSERERENARARAEAAQANEAREANLRVKRAESGSRFNLRYRNGIPPYALTPQGVAEALASYLEIAGMPVAASGGAITAGGDGYPATGAPGQASPRTGTGSDGGRGLSGLRKGLSLAEVETLLGPATSANEVQEGSIAVMKRSYKAEGMKVATSFVGGVLIDFSITPL